MSVDTFQKSILGGSTNGLPIAINATTLGSANTIHTAGSTDIHELWVSAFNYSNVDQTLYVLVGGSSASQIFSQVIPAGRGLVPILSGIITTGSVVIKAYASLTASISVVGFANVIVTV
jgi:hypothetical protein